MSTIYLAPADVPDVFKRAFPSYRGRTYAVEAAESVRLTDNYWSGGTKYTYRGVDIATGQVFDPECQEYGNPFVHPDVPTVALAPGKAVVCHRVFCGKDMGIKILVHPGNLRKLLADDGPQLSAEESRALAVVRSIKGGHHRRDEWGRRSLPGSYGAENALIRSLADKGLVTVNRAGAVTSAQVFGLSQTEGDPLPPADPEVTAWLESLPLREVAESWGLSVDAYNGREGTALGKYRHGTGIALGVKNPST